MAEQTPTPAKPKHPRGYLPPRAVRGFAFFVITLCIVISVVASVLAIWEFAKTDILWRTVATCFVVASGVAIFAFVNLAFGDKD